MDVQVMNKVTFSVAHALLFSALAAISFTGCQPAASTAKLDPAVIAKHREDRVLTEQPADPIGIQELIIQLAGDSPNPERASSDRVDVALLGQLGSAHSEASVFTDGQAAFTLTDPSYEPPTAEAEAGHEHGEDGDHEHEAESETASEDTSGHKEDCPCPFCASSKQSVPQAIVTFTDAEGETIPINAQQLFDLNGNEMVVVTGSAKLSVGQLMVTADKIYVRK